MELGEKDFRKISTLAVLGVLVVLAFFIVQPFIISIIGGLLLAYIFMPSYSWVNNRIRNKNISASIIVAVILIILVVLLWVVTPLILKQIFDVLLLVQKIDMYAVAKSLFPSASQLFLGQLSSTMSSTVSNAFATASTSLGNFLSNIPKLALDLFILGFIFFYSLRDSERLKAFAKAVSPLSDAKEKVAIKHFKDMTGAIIFGWMFVGVIQGILAGIGFFIFGVPSALILTILAILLSVIPFLGPAFIWVPVGIYLLTKGNTAVVISFLLYNLIIVSLADNAIRSYVISKRTNVHPSIILVGMLGGIFVFGVVGLIIGPLVLAYILTLLESFKDNNIYSLFS